MEQIVTLPPTTANAAALSGTFFAANAPRAIAVLNGANDAAR